MDATCWKVIGGMVVAVLGLVGAVRILWSAYRKTQHALLEEKERRVKEIEAFRDYIERRSHP